MVAHLILLLFKETHRNLHLSCTRKWPLEAHPSQEANHKGKPTDWKSVCRFVGLSAYLCAALLLLLLLSLLFQFSMMRFTELKNLL